MVSLVLKTAYPHMHDFLDHRTDLVLTERNLVFPCLYPQDMLQYHNYREDRTQTKSTLSIEDESLAIACVFS